MTSRSRALTLAIVVFTVFLDYIGVSLVIPVAAPLFLSSNVLFGASATLEYRTLILGLLLGTAPLVQFFSAPLLGAYADRAGRKPVLLLSVLATGLGHAMTAVGFLTSNIPLLFASRVLTGAGAGNLSAANSAVADVSDRASKVRNFGLVGMAVGLGFILGPYLGGMLSNPTMVPWFGYDTPLWVASALAIVNALFILLFFRETLAQQLHRAMDPFTGIRNIARAFTMPNLRVIYVTSFFIGFGYNFFTQFLAVFLVAKFQSTAIELGSLFAYVGVWTVIAQGLIARVLSKNFAPQIILRWAPIVVAFVLMVLAGVQHVQVVYWLLPLIVMAYGVNPPNITTLISDSAEKDSQGEALGINQSMQALAFAIPPIISGVAVSISIAMPLMLAALFFVVAWFVFIRFYRQASQPLFHEV